MGQCGSVHQGVYTIYESTETYTTLKQSIPSTSFSEEYSASIYSYPTIKIGYSYTCIHAYIY